MESTIHPNQIQHAIDFAPPLKALDQVESHMMLIMSDDISAMNRFFIALSIIRGDKTVQSNAKSLNGDVYIDIFTLFMVTFRYILIHSASTAGHIATMHSVYVDEIMPLLSPEENQVFSPIFEKFFAGHGLQWILELQIVEKFAYVDVFDSICNDIFLSPPTFNTFITFAKYVHQIHPDRVSHIVNNMTFWQSYLQTYKDSPIRPSFNVQRVLVSRINFLSDAGQEITSFIIDESYDSEIVAPFLTSILADSLMVDTVPEQVMDFIDAFLDPRVLEWPFFDKKELMLQLFDDITSAHNISNDLCDKLLHFLDIAHCMFETVFQEAQSIDDTGILCKLTGVISRFGRAIDLEKADDYECHNFGLFRCYMIDLCNSLEENGFDVERANIEFLN